MKSKKEKIRSIVPWVMLSILVLYGTYRDERVSEKLDGRKKWMDSVTAYMASTTNN